MTFAFSDSGDFQHFVCFSGVPLHLIRRLCIIPGEHLEDGAHFEPESDWVADFDQFSCRRVLKGWSDAIQSGVTKDLNGLDSLDLVYNFFNIWDTLETPHKCLEEIAKEFQRQKLRPKQTSVTIRNFSTDQNTLVRSTCERMERVFRDMLLAQV